MKINMMHRNAICRYSSQLNPAQDHSFVDPVGFLFRLLLFASIQSFSL